MRWRRLLLRRRRDEELQAEIEHYIEQETADNLARGMNFDEARGAALRKFGNQTVCREAEYEMNSMIAAESFWRNLMYAARQLRKQPGFAVTAILSLGMAMGANTAIFQLLDAVRLRSLPVYKPHELADIRVEGGRRGYGVSNGDYEITLPLWEQIRKHQQAFSNVAGWNRTDWEMGEGSDARNVDGLHVTGAFFDTLGVQPHRGRLLNEADDQKGCAAGPAIISYFLWQRDFGGRDDAIGATLRLDGKPYQVVGVTPPNFFGLDVGRRADAAIPDCTRPGWRKLVDERNFWSMNVIGRLQPGWTLDRASDHLRSASAHWIQEVLPVGYDAQTAGRWSNLRLHADAGSGGRSQLRNAYENSLWLMLGITGLVLVLGCTNLSSLLLARAVARQREMGLRLAIGASRKQLLAQLLTESLLLAFAGALCALVISRTLSRALVQALSMEGQRLHLDLATDWRVVGFITAVGLLTCVLFGLAPALKAASGDAFSAIRTGVRSTADRDRLSLQHVFVTAQIAVAVVLLIGAALFVRSFRNLATVNPGFELQGLSFAFVNFGDLKLPQERIRPMQRELLERVRSIPGIKAASSATHVPFSGSSWTLSTKLDDGSTASAQFMWVSPDYFKTVGVPIRAGRDISDHDTQDSRKVVLINETYARMFFPNTNPIGRTVHSLAEPGYPDAVYEVIGVVGDTYYGNIRGDQRPIAYAPETQNPNVGPGLPVVLKSSTSDQEALRAVREAITRTYPGAKVFPLSMQTLVHDVLIRERLLAWVCGFFGLLAIALAVIGVYGVVSHLTERRRGEVGIRLALGANRRDVMWLFLRRVGLLLAVGSVAGTAVSLLLSRGIASLLFGIAPQDTLTLVGSAAVLAGVGLAATLIPVMRAAAADPVSCLRCE